MKYNKLQHNHSHSHSHHHHHHHLHYSSGNGASSTSRSGLTSLTASKRNKKHNWGTRERSGMSFLIVIAFFAVFGLIILTEIFMIDERAHGGMILRGGGGYGNRLGDSMPDYDNVKDDYDLIDASLLNDNKLGYVQFQDNKFKIQGAESNDAGGGGGGIGGRLAGVLLNSASVGRAYSGTVGGGTGLAGNGPLIPWGKMLPTKVEETLPRYPFGTLPTDGSWQIVNGTRFKFFVFSAYYDRRDDANLIRVVGATKTRGPERVWCRLWYIPTRSRNNSTATIRKTDDELLKHRNLYKSVTVMARVKAIRENWNLKYSACFILCPVRTPDYDVPQHISIVARLRAPPGNLLQLRNTDFDPDFKKFSDKSKRNKTESKPNFNSPTSTLDLTKFSADEQIPEKLAVCVKPFHFDYNQALYLIEYLEFYALLGVSHFTFYNHTIGPQADCVLQHYIKGDIPDKSTVSDVEANVSQNHVPKFDGLASPLTSTETTSLPVRKKKSLNYMKPSIQILPWDLRMRSQTEIRTEGLFAALNDCLYRSMYRYKYLALVDLDEFIVPRYNDTLIELINSLSYRFRNRNAGAYSFQNAFFYLQFADDPLVSRFKSPVTVEMAQLRAALLTQRKTRRRYKLNPQKQRSKYICKPEATVEAGNHFVWEFIPGRGSLNVAPTEAILQHYRVCEFGGNDCIKAPSVLDRTATKYVNRLVERVFMGYKHLKDKCKLPDLPPLPKISQPPPERKPIIRKLPDKSKTINVGHANENLQEKHPHVPELKKNNENQRKESSAITKDKNNVKTTSVLNFERKNATTHKKEKLIINQTTTQTTETADSKYGIITDTDTKTTVASIRTTTANEQPAVDAMKNYAANKKKRKIVVFFVDDQGNPRARLEYH
uniref:Glycosyltransferase family 92 protein n=1 Tax=Glossina brevipalpis TaxID=37001 RepID=A0A1A9W2J7_9MUSC